MRLGEYEFSKASNSRRDFAVDAIFMHEQYDRRTHQNDIALVRLKEKATFNSMIWPICLPPSSMDYSVLEGQSAYVAGINLDVISLIINVFFSLRVLNNIEGGSQQVGERHRTAAIQVIF